MNLVIFLTDPHQIRKETYMETGGFPGWRHQTQLSGIILGLSCVTFALLFDPKYVLKEWITALVAACPPFLALSLPQFLEFRKISHEILNSGISRKPRQHGRNELVKACLAVVFFFIIVLGPFVLFFFTPPVVWLASVLGMIMGLSGSQFFFSLHIKRWERAHGVKLKRFTVWFRDERNRRVILEYGVRAEKI